MKVLLISLSADSKVNRPLTKRLAECTDADPKVRSVLHGTKRSILTLAAGKGKKWPLKESHYKGILNNQLLGCISRDSSKLRRCLPAFKCKLAFLLFLTPYWTVSFKNRYFNYRNQWNNDCFRVKWIRTGVIRAFFFILSILNFRFCQLNCSSLL